MSRFSFESVVAAGDVDRVDAVLPLGLEALAQGWVELARQAEAGEPAGHPREDAALVLVDDARLRGVVVSEAVPHRDFIGAVAQPADAVVEQVGAEEADNTS